VVCGVCVVCVCGVCVVCVCVCACVCVSVSVCLCVYVCKIHSHDIYTLLTLAPIKTVIFLCVTFLFNPLAALHYTVFM